MKPAVVILAVACVVAGAAGADPFNNNLKLLHARAKKETPKRATRTPRRPARRVHPTHAPRPAPPPPVSSLPVKYGDDRFGFKPRGGDLVVYSPNEEALTHVYVKQRLVSVEGNGHARVPDLAPGKYPVMVWSPDKGKRKTYWITIRPGSVAELTADL